jgi:hypothetical protein
MRTPWGDEADGDADTVNVPQGTCTLSDDGPEEPGQPNPNQYGNIQYDVEIYGPVNLVGSSAGSGASPPLILAPYLVQCEDNSMPEGQIPNATLRDSLRALPRLEPGIGINPARFMARKL